MRKFWVIVEIVEEKLFSLFRQQNTPEMRIFLQLELYLAHHHSKHPKTTQTFNFSYDPAAVIMTIGGRKKFPQYFHRTSDHWLTIAFIIRSIIKGSWEMMEKRKVISEQLWESWKLCWVNNSNILPFIQLNSSSHWLTVNMRHIIRQSCIHAIQYNIEAGEAGDISKERKKGSQQ